MLSIFGFKVVGEAGDGEAATKQIARLKPDVTLMDIRMPGLDGLSALKKINVDGYQTRVLIVTTYKDTTYLVKALAAGAAGFLLKDIPPEELAAAVRAVASGESRVDQAFLKSVLESLEGAGQDLPGTVDPLTAREAEVLNLIVEGLDNRAIAAVLGISPHTLKGYTRTLFQKLHVADRTQAAVKAIRLGLID